MRVRLDSQDEAEEKLLLNLLDTNIKSLRFGRHVPRHGDTLQAVWAERNEIIRINNMSNDWNS